MIALLGLLLQSTLGLSWLQDKSVRHCGMILPLVLHSGKLQNRRHQGAETEKHGQEFHHHAETVNVKSVGSHGDLQPALHMFKREMPKQINTNFAPSGVLRSFQRWKGFKVDRKRD